MSENSMNITISDNATKSEVSLPVDREQLGAFISSLLGQPQTIEREVYGTFSIDHSWCLHVHSLIDQRIRQQNQGALTAFSATINYENNLCRTINSVEVFKHFSETKKIKSQSIKMVWTYLISFPGKQVPEKQEIVLFVSAKAPSASRPEDPVRRLISTKYKLGVISYSITHTERTWGDDLENLLTQELELIIRKESFMEMIGSLTLALLALAFFAASFLLPELMNSIIQERQIENIYQNYPNILSIHASSISDLGAKLDLVLKAINPGNSLNKISVGYRLAMFVGGMAMTVWCMSLADRERPSFVVLTRESEEYRKSVNAKEKRGVFVHAFAFAASIAAGVIGNYLYFILSTKV